MVLYIICVAMLGEDSIAKLSVTFTDYSGGESQVATYFPNWSSRKMDTMGTSVLSIFQRLSLLWRWTV